MKFRALRADEIECRVAQVGKSGERLWCSLLLYKDARCDMNVLDEVIGAEKWQRDHKEIKGNVYGGIGILCDDRWIWKYDCGAESHTEAEKGEASDSFKRAGFNWGIGRELYTSPKIFVNLEKNEVNENTNTNKPQLAKGVYFYVAHITYQEENEKRTIDELVIKDKNGIDRFKQMSESKKAAVEKSREEFLKGVAQDTAGIQQEYNAPDLDVIILNLCSEKGVDIKTIQAHYEVKTINDMTRDDKVKAIAKLKKTAKKV